MKLPCLPPAALRASLCVALALLLGCSAVELPRISYSAVIERIDEPEGLYLSPVRGDKPLFLLCLRLDGGPRGHDSGRLWVRTMDLYSVVDYGEVGDAVRFSFPGVLPLDREVWFEQLAAYRVVPRPRVRRI